MLAAGRGRCACHAAAAAGTAGRARLGLGRRARHSAAVHPGSSRRPRRGVPGHHADGRHRLRPLLALATYGRLSGTRSRGRLPSYGHHPFTPETWRARRGVVAAGVTPLTAQFHDRRHQVIAYGLGEPQTIRQLTGCQRRRCGARCPCRRLSWSPSRYKRRAAHSWSRTVARLAWPGGPSTTRLR